MNDYAILVQARNRALAADSSVEQRALYRFFQHTLDSIDDTPTREVLVPAAIARWYIDQASQGEG